MTFPVDGHPPLVSSFFSLFRPGHAWDSDLLVFLWVRLFGGTGRVRGVVTESLGGRDELIQAYFLRGRWEKRAGDGDGDGDVCLGRVTPILLLWDDAWGDDWGGFVLFGAMRGEGM